MNMSACTKLNAEEEFLSGDTQPHDQEMKDLIETVLAGVRAACATKELHAFRSTLRFHAHSMREAWQRLCELLPPPSDAADNVHVSLCEKLREAGVSETRIGYVEHADRMMFRAHAMVHMLDEHSGRIPGDALAHKTQGAQAEWMCRFARLVLWEVAHKRQPADSPCLQFAVQFIVEEARDAYAYYATALEESEQAA